MCASNVIDDEEEYVCVRIREFLAAQHEGIDEDVNARKSSTAWYEEFCRRHAEEGDMTLKVYRQNRDCH
jgi:hypothetical protein